MRSAVGSVARVCLLTPLRSRTTLCLLSPLHHRRGESWRHGQSPERGGGEYGGDGRHVNPRSWDNGRGSEYGHGNGNWRRDGGGSQHLQHNGGERYEQPRQTSRTRSFVPIGRSPRSILSAHQSRTKSLERCVFSRDSLKCGKMKPTAVKFRRARGVLLPEQSVIGQREKSLSLLWIAPTLLMSESFVKKLSTFSSKYVLMVHFGRKIWTFVPQMDRADGLLCRRDAKRE